MYNCNEEFVKSEIARLFKDDAAYKLIMEAEDLVVQKRTLIQNCDRETWNKHALDIMREGLYLKFDQNLDLQEKLLKTAPSILAEASRFDRYWGTGISMNDPNIKYLSKWGQNHLGKLEMDIGEALA